MSEQGGSILARSAFRDGVWFAGQKSALMRAFSDVDNRRLIFRFFLYGFALTALSDVPNSSAGLYVVSQGILALLLLASLFIPIKPGLLLFFMLAIAGPDIVTPDDLDQAAYATASIWQMKIGFINPSWIVFGCLSLQLLRAWPWTVPPVFKRAIVWFATVPILTSMVYGGMFTEHARIEAVNDLKFPLMLIGSSILFFSVLDKNPAHLARTLASLTGVLLARHCMDLLYIFANIGPSITEGVSRASLDSAKGAVVYLAFWGIILVWTQRQALLGVSLAVPAIILLVGYGTRYIWITFLLGLFVLVFIMGTRRSILFISLSAAIMAGGIYTLSVVNPESARIVGLRSKDITEGRSVQKFAVTVDYNWLSRVDQVRYAEIINVLDSMQKYRAWLWGTGYGGFYEDEIFPFPLDLKSSFPQYSLDARRYYRTHEYFTHILLKFGLVGGVLISALWIGPGYALFQLFRSRKIFRRGRLPWIHISMLCLLGFYPTAMLQTFWSGKGLLLNGVTIACCMVFTKHYGERFMVAGSAKRSERKCGSNE